MPSENEVTLVVTSCARFDLLARTLRSFFENSGCDQMIVAEDWNREGQVKMIDRAYGRVKTEYIMHFEDDWEVFRVGLLFRSFRILAKNPSILQVWLRAHNDTNNHPIVQLPQYPFKTMDATWEWKGFSWNPGLRRKSDWEKIGGYMKYWQGSSDDTERYIGNLYAEMGYHAAILEPEGYVRHIGGDRSTK
jgi:hypothetical protein